MSLMVISDTHGRTTAVMNVLLRNKEIEHLIHLGDMVADAQDIEAAFSAVSVIKIAGNNDFFSREREEVVINWNDLRIFACHGHRYGVRGSKTILAKRAKELGANFALFGHTHIKFDEEIDGVRLLNPSNMGYFILEKNGEYTYNSLY